MNAIDVTNDIEMVKEGLRQPKLAPLEKKFNNQNTRKKRVFFNQQTKQLKEAIKKALVTEHRELVLRKVQFPKNYKL